MADQNPADYPIGTNAFPAFERNVENLDVAVNDRSRENFPDRKGVQRYTYHGIEQRADRLLAGQGQQFDGFMVSSQDQFQRFLEASGYSGGDRQYAPGIVLAAHNEGFVRCEPDGKACLFYTPKSDTALPYTTTGDWTSESSLFVVRGDDSLRQELADPEKGAGMVGFLQIGPNAVGRPLLDKVLEMPRTPSDYGADQLDPIDDYLIKAIESSRIDGVPCGTIVIPSGKWLLSSLLDIDLVQTCTDAPLGDPSGTYRQFELRCDGTIVMSPGAGLIFRRGFNPKFSIKVEGGAWGDSALRLEDECISPIVSIYGNHYKGTLFKSEGLSSGHREGVKSLREGTIIAQSCGQAFYISGTSGLGNMPSVWDIGPQNKGPQLVDCYDANIPHFENYTDGTVFDGKIVGTLEVIRGGSHHFGTLAVGNRAQLLVKFVNSYSNTIDALNLADTFQMITGLEQRGGSLAIGAVTGVGIDRAIIVGNDATLTISNFLCLNFGSAIIINHDSSDPSYSSVQSARVTINGIELKDHYGTTVPGIRNAILTSSNVLEGHLIINGGGFTAPNAFGEIVTPIELKNPPGFLVRFSNFIMPPHRGDNSLAIAEKSSFSAKNCYFGKTVFCSQDLQTYSHDGRSVILTPQTNPLISGVNYPNSYNSEIHITQPINLTPTEVSQAVAEAQILFGNTWITASTVSAPVRGEEVTHYLVFRVPYGVSFRILTTNAAIAGSVSIFSV